MVRRLDEAWDDGEAPIAKVPAPQQALISNIKTSQGHGGGRGGEAPEALLPSDKIKDASGVGGLNEKRR